METELWICPECLEKYDIKEKRVLKIGTGAFVSEQKMGICPMCHEYRNLVKVEPLPEHMPTKEGLEWLSQAQSSTAENQQPSNG